MKDVILVTGGAGYIGSHAVKKLSELGSRVVVFDDLSRGWKGAVEVLRKRWPIEFVKGDIRSARALTSVFRKYKISAVMHFAGLCSVDESMKYPAIYFDVNTSGTLNLLRQMALAKVKQLIFSSTCAVYGEAQYLPIDEKHEVSPVNPYGESKLLAEREIKWFHYCHGIDSVVLRYFNVCGADEEGLIGDSKKPSLLLVQNVIRGALGIEPFKLTYPRVKTKDGSPVRDYVDVLDLIDAHLSALKYLESRERANLVINLGTGRGYSVKEIVGKCEGILGTKIECSRGLVRQGEYAALFADNALARKLLKWQPEHTLRDSVQNLVRWYQSHPHGFKR